MRSNLHKPYTVRVHCAKSQDICNGGFCKLPTKQCCGVQILTQGEGKAPPLKIKNNQEEAYALSYPNGEIIEAITIAPLYIQWMGRRWYTSP